MIYITDDIRISKVDENCLQIEIRKPVISKNTKKTTMQWKWFGYYGSLKDALKGALKKQLFDLTEDELQAEDLFERIEIAEHNVIRAAEELGD